MSEQTVVREHRRAILPRWRGNRGDYVKGSVYRRDGTWLVVYSHLLGLTSTARHQDLYATWSLAMSEYRRHDRTIRERRDELINAVAGQTNP